MCLKCTRKVERNRPGNMFSVRETGMMMVQLSMLGYQKKSLSRKDIPHIFKELFFIASPFLSSCDHLSLAMLVSMNTNKGCLLEHGQQLISGSIPE